MIKITNLSTGFSKICRITKITKDFFGNERYNVCDFGLDTLYIDTKTLYVSSDDIVKVFWIEAELL